MKVISFHKLGSSLITDSIVYTALVPKENYINWDFDSQCTPAELPTFLRAINTKFFSIIFYLRHWQRLACKRLWWIVNQKQSIKANRSPNIILVPIVSFCFICDAHKCINQLNVWELIEFLNILHKNQFSYHIFCIKNLFGE